MRGRLALACAALAWVRVAIACATFTAAQDAGDAGASLSDAEADAPPSDAGAGGACTVPFDYVLSFDDDASIADWSPVTSNGSLSITGMLPNDAAPPTPPAALYAEGVVPDAGAVVKAYAAKVFELVPTHADMRFALYVPSTTAFAVVGCGVAFAETTSPQTTTLQVLVSKKTLLTELHALDGGGIFESSLGPFPASDFAKLQILFDADVDAGVAHATVNRLGDGDVPIAQEIVDPFQLPPGANTLAIACGILDADLGADATTGNPVVQVAVDDLAVHGCQR